jgi:hypothetical protein
MDITIENRDKIISLLKEGTCPICNKGKFKNPLQHIRQAHKINSIELKDLLLYPRSKGFASPDFSKKCKERNLTNNSAQKMLEKRPKINVEIADLAKSKLINTIKEKINDDPNYREYMLNKAKNAQKKAHLVRRIKVIRISDNGEEKVYESIKDAARDNGVVIGTIRYALKKGIKSAGYKWKYAKKD